jgi:hypothetical protein
VEPRHTRRGLLVVPLLAVIMAVAGLATAPPAQAAGTAVITVTVSAPGGIAGTQYVWLIPAAGTTLIRAVDSSGSFSFTGLDPGTYRIFTSQDGLGEPAMWYRSVGGSASGTRDEATATPVTATNGATTTVNLPFGRLSGTLRDRVTSATLPGIYVAYEDVGDPQWKHGFPELGKETNANGRYGDDNLGIVVPGSYRISIADMTVGHISGFSSVGNGLYHGQDREDARIYAVGPASAVNVTDRLSTWANVPPGPFVGSTAATRVAVLGDSLTQQSVTEIHNELNPTYRTSVRGLSGAGIANLGNVADKLMALSADRPNRVVLALGTNNANGTGTLDAALNDMKALIQRFRGISCVAVIKINDDYGKNPDGTIQHQPRATDLNARYTTLPGLSGTLGVTVKMPTLSGYHWDEWADADRRRNAIENPPDPTNDWFEHIHELHFQSEGERNYARMIKAAADGCA